MPAAHNLTVPFECGQGCTKSMASHTRTHSPQIPPPHTQITNAHMGMMYNSISSQLLLCLLNSAWAPRPPPSSRSTTLGKLGGLEVGGHVVVGARIWARPKRPPVAAIRYGPASDPGVSRPGSSPRAIPSSRVLMHRHPTGR